MDYLPGATQAPIQRAVELLQPKLDTLLRLYRRSSRTELALIGGATLLTLYNLRNYIRAKRQNLNLPPHVGYSLPIFGHLLYILRDPNGFLDWCADNYGEVFDLDLMTATVTVTAGRSAEEMLKAPSDQLSLEEGVLKDVLFMHYVIDPTTFEIGFKVNPAVAKDVIPANKIPGFTENIIKGLELGLHELVGDKQSITIDKVDVFMQRFVAYMSVPSLIGPEVATNPTVIRSFADFTKDVTSNIGIFLATPKFLHRFLLPYLQSVAWHRRVMKEHVAPVVRARREKMKQLGEQHELPPNFLQGLLEFQKPDGSYYSDEEVAQSVLLVAFASVHTTSMNLSFCLYWLLARPDLQERLEKEIKDVLGDDGPITSEALDKMVFLDNFIREVLRQGVDKLATTKAVLCDTYTFANGYQVPKGRRVQSMGRRLNMGLNSNRSRIDEMDPDLSGNKHSTQPGRDFVTFGLGKHLCPGRFFAVHEIKLSLIFLFTRYKISIAARKPSHPVQTLAGVMSQPSSDPITLTRRT